MYRTAQVIQSYTTNTRLFGGITMAQVLSNLALMMAVAHERRQLKQLDPRALKDMGLDQQSVDREAGRAVWDLPMQRKIDR